MKINLLEFAVKVTNAEGGVTNLPVAQVSEVIACVGRELRKLSFINAVRTMWAIYRRSGVR